MIAAALFLAAAFTRPMERVATLDPVFAQSVYDSRVVQLLYETPLNIDYYARPYTLSPGYCELPEVSEDGLVYTFRTRGGSAADMVSSLARLRDPEIVTPNGWLMKSVDTITAKDDRTVEIRLKNRCHFFPWLMAMSPASVRRPDGSGTGPFELASWRKNHEMVFRRRSPSPKQFDTVRYLVIDDLSTQWLMFLKGEIDFLGEISKDNWDVVMGKDGNLDPSLAAQGVKLYSIPTLEVFYMGVNMRDPVLGGNKKLRQALNAAFDYPRWEEYFSKRTVQADGPVPPGVDGKLSAPFKYAFDLDLAKRLMKEAGYADGIDPQTGRRLVLTLSFGRASTGSREMGELLASFYEKIGVKLELSFQTWDAFLKAVNEGRVQIYNMGWVGDYPDAENFLQLFYSKNVSPGPNHSYYVNAEYDREYDAAMSASSSEERNRHWAACQEMIREDCPWIFSHFGKANSLVRPRVGNYVPSDFPYGQEAYFTVAE
jgi:peptide/nickel transport system substrate-binding protein